MAPSGGFDSFSVILDAVTQRLGLSAKIVEQRIRRDWIEIVGEQVATHTRPEHIRLHRLSVLVDHSIWMQQLAFLKPDLLRRIRVHIGGETVQDLVFRIGDLSRIPLEVPATREPVASSAEDPAPHVMREANAHTSAIRDPDLRAHLTKVIAKALASARSTAATDR